VDLPGIGKVGNRSPEMLGVKEERIWNEGQSSYFKAVVSKQTQ